jgi:protein tyrosine/serine phosphatase
MLVEIEEMEEEQEQTAPGDEEITMTIETPTTRGTIWDDDMVKQIVCNNNIVKKWRCLWCKKESIKWNATKATAHLAKCCGQDIAVCTARHDKNHADSYKSFQANIDKKRKCTLGL